MNMTGRPSAGAAGLGKGAARSPASHTIQEPLRDRVGRAIYEAPGTEPGSWYDLSEERREPWRQDADRAIAVIQSE